MLKKYAKHYPFPDNFLVKTQFFSLHENSFVYFRLRRKILGFKKSNAFFKFFLGTSLGSTCKHATVTCPGGKTTYPVTCSLGCQRDYSIKGASTTTCQTSGQWTSYATSYCRRNNDPPTQVSASDEYPNSPYCMVAFVSRLVTRITRIIN